MAPPVPYFRTVMYTAWPFVRRWLTLYLLEAAAEHMPDIGDYWPSSESEDAMEKPEAASSDQSPPAAESSSEKSRAAPESTLKSIQAAPAEGDEAVEVCLSLVTECFAETDSSENRPGDLIPWLLLIVLLLLLYYGLPYLSSRGRDDEPGPPVADAHTGVETQARRR
ncbi:hypothetical protein U9M48_010985 [Paspalum notatum var. saurae]|uniref:Uncharacterized protein n=1 Tax=Paspalum notatum var. saurae TaxID=547442 RepID=A0AAQ3WGP1_PASNO